MNIHTIAGNLAADPELREIGEKKVKCCSLRVATREYRGETEWHHVDVFGKDAEFAATYAKKGDKVGASGPRRTRTYTNSSGEEKTISTIKCSMGAFELLTNKKERDEAGF